MKIKISPVICAVIIIYSALAGQAAAQVGAWSLGISIPEGNWQNYPAPDGRTNRFGFLGVAAELQYHYGAFDALSLKAGYILDHPQPFGARLERKPETIPGFDGDTRHAHGFFLFLQNKRGLPFGEALSTAGSYQGLDLGYGLCLSLMTRTKIAWADGWPVDSESYIKKDVELGLVGSAAYISPWDLYASVQYAPNLIKLAKRRSGFDYSHLAFLDLGFRVGR